jgi:hypothetical protein
MSGVSSVPPRVPQTQIGQAESNVAQQAGGRGIEQGWSLGRIALAVVTLGISELIRAIHSYVVRQGAPPEEGRVGATLGRTGIEQGSIRTPDDRLKDTFKERGLEDAEGAKALLGKMAQARDNLTSQERRDLNQRMFGGGNVALRVVFNHPDILTMPDVQREQAFRQEYTSLAGAARERQLEILERQRASMGEDNYEIQKLGIDMTFDMTLEDAIKYLDEPGNRDTVTKFLQETEGLNFDDTMAVVRMDTPNLERASSAIDKLFSGETLSETDREEVRAFFPFRSS